MEVSNAVMIESDKIENETGTEKENAYAVVKADPSRKRVTGGRKRAGNRIPDDILNNKDLVADIAILPQNYNFEVSFHG